MFLSSGCGHKPYPHSLLVADSLSNVNPDSAIALLKSMASGMRNETEDTRMYYRLLRIKANDKAYITHTSDSVILPVLHYYIEKNNSHLPEAYYYAGRVYRDLGDAPQALDYFQKADEALPEGEVNRLRSNIYSQMGTLFTYQEIHEEALKMFKKAYRCDEILKDSSSLVYDLRDMAYEHRCGGKRDSALIYYQKAYQLARIIRKDALSNMVQSQIASLYIEQGKYELAKRYLQPSLNTEDAARKSGVYSIAAKLYHSIGQLDSASYYYNELLNFGTVYAKKSAYRGLAKIALKENHPQGVIDYLFNYEHYLDSIQNITTTESLQRIHSLYNYQLRVKENNLLKEENKQKQKAIIYILSIAVLTVMAIVSIYIQYSKRKKAEYEIKLTRLSRIKEEQYQRSMLFIEENKKKIADFEKRLCDTDQENSTLRTQLLKQKEIMLLSNRQAEMEWNEQDIARAEFLKSEIYLTFVRLAQSNAEIETSKEQLNQDWILLEHAIDSAYKGFSYNLRSIYKFSEYEWHVCLLIKSEISPAGMAIITSHSAESITATRRRLYKKVFQEKGSPKDWDKFILSL